MVISHGYEREISRSWEHATPATKALARSASRDVATGIFRSAQNDGLKVSHIRCDRPLRMKVREWIERSPGYPLGIAMILGRLSPIGRALAPLVGGEVGLDVEDGGAV